jgi:hypothetical protein
MYGNIDVDWSASAANTLTMTAGSVVVDLVTYFKYVVGGGGFPMSNGDALYIILDGVTSNVTPQVTPIVSLPWGLPIQVLGFVENGEFVPHLFSVAGMGELSVGEEVVLGQDLSKVIRYRLGITGESAYEAYTSFGVILPTDNYPKAISKLDASIFSVLNKWALEEEFIADGITTDFTTTLFEFNDNNIIPDIQVFVNDRRAKIDPLGGTAKDYHKISSDTIRTHTVFPAGTEILIRQERTGGAIPGVGGANDLTNIYVNPQPITNGAHSMGTTSKAWNGYFIKDKITSQVYEIIVSNGVFSVEPRP